MTTGKKDRTVTITKVLVFGGLIVAFVAPISYVFSDGDSDREKSQTSQFLPIDDR
jgi:hypothetical protein